MTNRNRQITMQARAMAIVRCWPGSFRAWCEHCLDAVPALTPESAREFMQVSAGTVYHLLECGKLHRVEASPTSDLICGNSLSAGSRL
jgi:hypothetical protein